MGEDKVDYSEIICEAVDTIVSKKIVSVFSKVIYIFRKLMRLNPYPYKN